MPNIKSAQKRANKSEKQRKLNSSHRSMVRTYIKKVRDALKSHNKQIAQDTFKKMQSILDKNARKGIIHKNKAARYKSKFYSKIITMK